MDDTHLLEPDPVMTPLRRCPRFAAAVTLCVLLSSSMSAQPAPTETTLREQIDASRLRIGRDSFVVMLRGAASGWQRLIGARDGSVWIGGDAIDMPGIVQQQSVFRMDAALHELSIRQEGTMQDKPMKISLDFAAGRVKGSALTPSGGVTTLAIDTTVTVGTIDDNAVMPLLPAVRWRDSLALSFPVIASGKGTTSAWTLRVLGADTTTVPAGHFSTWRFEMRAGRSRTEVHVTRSAPYRVVRIRNGPVFEMLLLPEANR
jgi:hypothetical protein